MGFAEALAGVYLGMKMKHLRHYRFGYFHLSCQLPFQPHFLPMSFTPKKEGGKLLGYFRFLINAKLARPKTAAIETAPIIAASVLINGAGVSGVIGPDGEIAGSTFRYVIECEP